jgi:hypothetical protein
MYKGKGHPTTRLCKHDVEAEVLFPTNLQPGTINRWVIRSGRFTSGKNLGMHYLEDCVNSTPVLRCFV